MNANTKEAFIKFINDVEILAQGVVHLTGVKDTSILLKNAETLKSALQKDETILD
jgi:hypothetical protein